MANRSHSRQAEKPRVRNMTLTPQGSRDYQFENAGAHRHQDDQERDSKKANSKTDKAVLNQSERAKRKAIQHQMPAFAVCGPQNTSCNRASSCRQCELAQKHYRAVPRMESQGSIRLLHD